MIPLESKASEFLCFAVMTCELAKSKTSICISIVRHMKDGANSCRRGRPYFQAVSLCGGRVCWHKAPRTRGGGG
jgi:hypothetical protein